MKNILLLTVLFLCGCRTATTTVDPLLGLPTIEQVSPAPMLPALQIADDRPKFLPPFVVLGSPEPLEPERKVFDRPELPALPPQFPD